jgi:hypothetical protein
MSKNAVTPHRLLLSLAILFLIGYAVFNSRFLLKGPEVSIAGTEKDGEVIKTDSRDFSLQGTASHSSYISINNRPILVDEFGNFNEKLLLSNGVSVIDVYARDKFGKEVRKKIDVVYTGDQATTTDIEEIALRVQSSSNASSSIQSSSSISSSSESISTQAGIQ